LILEVSNLSKNFAGFRAVEDLSFSVNGGEIYGLLGQNGAGKSTTIRILLSLIKPDKGSIRFFDKPYASTRKESLKKIGAIIERPDHYKYLTALENLSLFSRISGCHKSKQEHIALLEKVGLGERVHSKVRTFSMGMKQRLGLAIALVHDPALLILDEPANGLDPQGIADIRQLIMELSKKEGKTLIVSSHLLSEMEQMADSMLIMDRGRKIAEGKVSELLDARNSVVIVQTTDNERVAASLSFGSFSDCLQIKGRYLYFNMDKDDVPELVRQIQATGAGLLSLNTRHSLEEYFLQLTNPNVHVGAA
jgi:ABC-type multidrug transport system ATPase subunit